jgi:carboxypeptidase family protein
MGFDGDWCVMLARSVWTNPMRPRCCTLILFCALFTSARVALAQTITGRIVAAGDRAPVTGVIVVLLDSAGRAVVTGLAEDDGTFRLNAPRPGRYSVRVERVGFRSNTSAPVLVAEGTVVDVPIAIASESVSLLAVRVSADRRCVVRPQEGLAAAQLWDEARKALSATQLTQLAQAAAHARRDPHRFLVRARKFERDLSPGTLSAFHEQDFEVEAETATPFVSRDPELLDRDGYMSGSMESGSMLYAPDAAILLSDRFLDSHCLRVEESRRHDRGDLIGLAFEPTHLSSERGSHGPRVDVSGVLWLERSTAELRYLEYHYVNLPIEVPNEAAGGLLEFRPLPDGRWIVWRWYVRAPQMERRQSFTNPLPYAHAESRLELKAVHEEGAEILEVLPPGSRNRSLATLHGIVFDSIRGSPIGGARVFLSGTSFAAESKSDGSYTIEALPPGKYTISVLATRLDSLLLDPPAHDLTLSAGEDQRVDFAVPSVRGLGARLCPDLPGVDSAAILLGVVRDTSESTAPGAHVRAEWQAYGRPGSNVLVARTVAAETRSAAGGRFAVCGVPPNTRVMVRAQRDRNSAASPVLHLGPGEVRRIDLRLRAP